MAQRPALQPPAALKQAWIKPQKCLQRTPTCRGELLILKKLASKLAPTEVISLARQRKILHRTALKQVCIKLQKRLLRPPTSLLQKARAIKDFTFFSHAAAVLRASLGSSWPSRLWRRSGQHSRQPAVAMASVRICETNDIPVLKSGAQCYAVVLSPTG